MSPETVCELELKAFMISAKMSFMRFNARNAEHFFALSVLLTDVTRSSTDGIVNIHNQHQWAEDNPHV
jgi:hypothetical protein